jgi:beta-glucuronidase
MGGDTIVERFGLRTVCAAGQQILLNGEPVRLRGVNRHESHPQFGPAVPAQVMVEDLQHIKDLGANFIRCVHYPQDQQFLDLCDQVGILVWEESLGWGNSAAELLNPTFGEMQVRQTRAMVRNSINHPAIILWGFMNECASDHMSSRPLYQAMCETIRQQDPSRLVTFASCRNEKDVCFDFVDVVAMNTYPGWIGELDWNIHAVTRIAPGLKRLAEFMSQPARRDKPFLMSEIGACGLYGSHHLARAQWTEEFQADYMAEAARCVLGNPRFCGIALWQMIDSRSYGPYGQVRTKPNGTNLAGLIDEYRRRKLSYEAVRAVFGEFRKA